jgi:hypothetical protein
MLTVNQKKWLFYYDTNEQETIDIATIQEKGTLKEISSLDYFNDGLTEISKQTVTFSFDVDKEKCRTKLVRDFLNKTDHEFVFFNFQLKSKFNHNSEINFFDVRQNDRLNSWLYEDYLHEYNHFAVDEKGIIYNVKYYNDPDKTKISETDILIKPNFSKELITASTL